MTSVDLLNRSLGTLTSSEFARIQNTRLLEALQLQAWPRFGHQLTIKGVIGSQNANVGEKTENTNNIIGVVGQRGNDAIAHRAGVNAIVIDRFEGR